MSKIMIDIDGVLADFCEGFTMQAKKLGYKVEIVSTKDQPSWNLKGMMNPTIVNDTWRSIRSETNWWRNLKALPHFTQMNELRGMTFRHEIIFATNRTARAENSQSITYQSTQWLESVGLFMPSVVVCKNKGLVAAGFEADYILDDRPSNLDEVAEHSPKTQRFLMDRLYNAGVDNEPKAPYIRVKTLEEFLEAVESNQ